VLLLLALPGGAYLYQGEELGLPEVEDLPPEVLQDPIWERSGHANPGRDGSRVPIPWSGDRPPYGFSPDGVATWLPQPAGWGTLTVAAETGREGSMLELYRAALRLRRHHPALGDGTLRWVDGPADALVFARDPGLVCMVNFGPAPLPLPAGAEVLLASVAPGRDGLAADAAAWLQVTTG
jgi:alpha-glucosidase